LCLQFGCVRRSRGGDLRSVLRSALQKRTPTRMSRMGSWSCENVVADAYVFAASSVAAWPVRFADFGCLVVSERHCRASSLLRVTRHRRNQRRCHLRGHGLEGRTRIKPYPPNKAEIMTGKVSVEHFESGREAQGTGASKHLEFSGCQVRKRYGFGELQFACVGQKRAFVQSGDIFQQAFGTG
jgi:hypothetical protein